MAMFAARRPVPTAARNALRARFRDRLRGCCGGGREQRCTVRAWLGSFRSSFCSSNLVMNLVRRVWTGSLPGFGSAMNERDLGLDRIPRTPNGRMRPARPAQGAYPLNDAALSKCRNRSRVIAEFGQHKIGMLAKHRRTRHDFT